MFKAISWCRKLDLDVDLDVDLDDPIRPILMQVWRLDWNPLSCRILVHVHVEVHVQGQDSQLRSFATETTLRREV